MLMAMVVIFAICWLPLNIVHMILEYRRFEISHYKILFLSTHVIAMSSTIYNPFLYSWLNENFRKEFQQIVPCLFNICSCFNQYRSNTTIVNNNLNMPTIGDADINNDRSTTHHMLLDTTLDGNENDFKVKTDEFENIPLTLIKRRLLIEESTLKIDGATEVDTNTNNISSC